MKPIERNEILGIGEYETLRPRFCERVFQEKRRRRLALGPQATFLFENRDTVLFQIQEMVRAERITKESAILHEIETYNALLPGPSELSVTLFFEILDPEQRVRFLTAAQGIEKTLRLRVGNESIPAQWEPSRELEDRTSAVHYLKFPLSPSARKVLADGPVASHPEVSFSVDHPEYRATTLLPDTTLRALSEDLSP